MENKDHLQAILSKLLQQIPEFRTEYDSILKDNDGEILEYVIFGGLARFFIDKFKTGDKKIVDKIQHYLEELLRINQEEVTDLVVLGFLENLHQSGDCYKNIKKILIQPLKEKLIRLETWEPKKL